MKPKKVINPDKLPGYCMPMQLDACTPQEYRPTLEMLFHDDKFTKTVEHRKRMFEAAGRPNANAFAIRKGIEQDDRRIADMLLLALQRRTMVQNERRTTSINMLWRKIPKDDKARQDIKEKCSRSLDMVVFLSDLVESKLTDIKDCLDKLFPDEGWNFEQFNGVSEALKQLRDAFGLTRDEGSEGQRQLFADYAESMEAYFDKRMKTFIDKSHKLRIKEQGGKGNE